MPRTKGSRNKSTIEKKRQAPILLSQKQQLLAQCQSELDETKKCVAEYKERVAEYKESIAKYKEQELRLNKQIGIISREIRSLESDAAEQLEYERREKQRRQIEKLVTDLVASGISSEEIMKKLGMHLASDVADEAENAKDENSILL